MAAVAALGRRARRWFPAAWNNHAGESEFPDEAALRPNVVLAVPGYIQSDGERGWKRTDGSGLLSRFETLWPDTTAENAAHRRWAAEHPKRALAAAAAVGTIDQALLSGLPVRHAHLRGAALLRALIVADEVHASDAYMTQLLTGVLRRHVDAGGHALLLSATLGSEARDRLLIQPTRRLRPNQKRSSAGEGHPSQSPYPALSDAVDIRPVAGTSTEKTIRVSLDPGIDDDAPIAAHAADAARAGAKVLVIRNDVKGAVAIQRALEARLGAEHPVLLRAGGVPAPHHGRFAAADRRVLDDRLVELSETWTSPFGQVIKRMKIPGWMVKSLEEHEENARITDRTSTELRFHWGGGNFVYNRHGLDFAEDAGGGPSSPVRKGRRRRE